MKKIFILLLFAVSICFFSCQSYQTKQKICGTWAYAGGGAYCVLDFHEDNTMYMSALYSSSGTYSIDDKDVNILFSDGSKSSLRLSKDGYLYAPDGSRYAKVSNKCE